MQVLPDLLNLGLGLSLYSEVWRLRLRPGATLGLQVGSGSRPRQLLPQPRGLLPILLQSSGSQAQGRRHRNRGTGKDRDGGSWETEERQAQERWNSRRMPPIPPSRPRAPSTAAMLSITNSFHGRSGHCYSPGLESGSEDSCCVTR